MTRPAVTVDPAQRFGRPRLLDLFSGAGGAARGYQLAGFVVTGVDINPQPRYAGDAFVQADAMQVLARLADGAEPWPGAPGFDAIHASPPCQRFTAYRRRPGVGHAYPDLIAPVRDRLKAISAPWVIENVAGAPLVAPLRLCGSSFGLDVRRHRYFESNVDLLGAACDHAWQRPRFAPATNRTALRRTVEVGVWRIPLAVQAAAMGIDWMTLPELSQAIPPAYTQHVGEQLLAHVLTAA